MRWKLWDFVVKSLYHKVYVHRKSPKVKAMIVWGIRKRGSYRS